MPRPTRSPQWPLPRLPGLQAALALVWVVAHLLQPPGQAAAEGWQHVLIVGWDGVQRDHLHACLRRRLPGCEGGLPHLQALSGGRVFDLVVTSGSTETKPGWVEILTGLDARSLGIDSNLSFRTVPAEYSLFQRLASHLGSESVVTLFIAGKGANLGARCDLTPPEPWCETASKLRFFRNTLGANRAVGAVALAQLAAHRNARHIVAFVHFREPDHSGHWWGENSTVYTAGLVDVDRWLGRLVDKLRQWGLLQRTLIYVVTDHGFDEGRRSHHNAPFGFVASNDPGILRAADRKDITPTVLKRFGVPLEAVDSVPAVAGRALDEIPATCRREGEPFLDYPGAPDCCPGLTRISLDAYFPGLTQRRPCLPATGGQGNRSGFCTPCGDGHCRFPEQPCNCPEDCREVAPRSTTDTGGP